MSAGDGRLQQRGADLVRRLHHTLATDRGAAATETSELVALLRARDGDGDDLLADDLETLLRGEELPGAVEIDLLEAADAAASSEDGQEGGFLNRNTGETVYAFLASEDGEEGEDPNTGSELVDVSGREWVFVRNDGRSDYEDMVAFIGTIDDPVQAVRLQDAITGAGAFRRFRDLVYRLDVGREWGAFRDDRRIGALRLLLRDEGIRPV